MDDSQTDDDKMVNAKLNALQTFAIRKEIEKWKTEWAYRSAFIAYCMFMGLGAFTFVYEVVTVNDAQNWIAPLLISVFWFIALFIAVGAFGTPRGKGG